MDLDAASRMREILGQRAAKVEGFLSQCIPEGAPGRLAAAMRYSLKAGGKRLRPVLCLTFARLCGLEEERVLPFAAAIDMIHTYSLIHDDLPAMDNDDFRRGKPAAHRQFDEATAILAGDGLLADAFALAGSVSLAPENVLRALVELARAAGSPGMAGGQMLDMQYTGATGIGIDELAAMQAMKTGAMLRASCLCGAILAGASADSLACARAYGASLGLAFQIADDILDVTASIKDTGKPRGSDAQNGKNTWPGLIGIAESRRLAQTEAEKAKAAVPPGPESDFLKSLADFVVCRGA